MASHVEDRKQTATLSAAQDACTASMPAASAVAFQVVFTVAGTLTITFEATVDESTWVAVAARNVNSGAWSTTTTTAGIYVVPCAGYRRVRARVSAYTSGTVTCTANHCSGGVDSQGLPGTVGATSIDTELPAAATLADATALPSAPQVGAANEIYNGSTLDLMRSANAASNTSGTGLAGAGGMVWDGSAWQRVKGKADGTQLVGGFSTIVSTTLTRPANTTAYAAGDEITDTGGTIRTITSAARVSGGSGVITGVAISFSTVWTTMPSLELWIFDTTSTPATDNAAFAPADGETDTCIGVIPLSTTYAGTVNFMMDSGPISFPFVTVGSANLFARIVVRNAAQDSANSSTIKMRFRILQD